MPRLERKEEGTLKPYTVTGNNLDILLWEIKEEAEQFDLRSVELESRSIANIDSLLYPSSEFESSEELERAVLVMKFRSKITYDLLGRIKSAVEQDGTSELKID